MALFLESTVLECIFSLCNAATRTWIAAKGSNAYYADSLSRSFVLSVYDESENWSLGQCGVHPVSGENFGKCRIIIFINSKQAKQLHIMVKKLTLVTVGSIGEASLA